MPARLGQLFPSHYGVAAAEDAAWCTLGIGDCRHHDHLLAGMWFTHLVVLQEWIPAQGLFVMGAADHTMAPLGLLLPISNHGNLGSWTPRQHPPQALPALGMTSGGVSQQGLAHGRQ